MPLNQTIHPICVEEILKHIPDSSKSFLDATFGRGGHTQAFLHSFPDIQVVAIDCDKEAIDYAKQNFGDYLQNGQLKLFHKNFFVIYDFLKKKLFDVILIDLGVSSSQLDSPERGFSVYHEGPLDMRFDLGQSLTAKDLIQNASQKELTGLFQKYGEIKSPYKVVKSILHQRKKQPLVRTTQLSNLIAKSTGWRQKGKHPATSYFRALRIVVNNELAPLESALKDLMECLNSKGRLFVISFHSLEDRIVKWTFKNSHLGSPLYKKVITPSYREQKTNPRSRSAKLRIFQKSFIV